ncbi:hypothetical protein [Clostridium sp.]|uniref:hypothetical protein n=1 Tax=Clostridium sp. TaxID=1506 RepID=UPI0026104E2F|nr:hypothetical protein [Clostridium sp.]
MQIEKEKFTEALTNSILCPSDLGVVVSKEDKTCGYSVDCKRCWNEALNGVSNFELTGGIEGCQK